MADRIAHGGGRWGQLRTLGAPDRRNTRRRRRSLFENPQLSQQESGLPATATSPTEDPTIMATNIQLLTQQAGVAQATATVVGHGLTAAGGFQRDRVTQQGQTSVANVAATSTSPQLAAAIANTYVAKFIASQQAQQQASVNQALNLVERQVAALSRQQLAGPNGQALLDRAESLRILANLQDGGAQVVQPAKVPSSPSSPRVKSNTVLGLLIGLLLGVGLAFLLERLDRRMKTVEDLEADLSSAVARHGAAQQVLRTRSTVRSWPTARRAGGIQASARLPTLLQRRSPGQVAARGVCRSGRWQDHGRA